MIMSGPSLKTVEYIASLGLTEQPLPRYCPDLVPSDFPLFRPMKDGLCGQLFPNNTVIAAVKQQVTCHSAYFCLACRLLLIADENVGNGGDCVEK